MIPKKVICPKCGCKIEVATYRKFVKCPNCSEKSPFEGFEYELIFPGSSMYASVDLWTDCPVCRSRNMFFDRSRKMWECPDCKYTITSRDKNSGVFWFCDDCEAYLNVQPGFDTKSGRWVCTECGYENDVTSDNIIFGDERFGDIRANFKKAMSKAGEIGSKVEKSLNEAKDKVTPVAGKAAGEVAKQSKKVAGEVAKQSKKAASAIGAKAQEVKEAREQRKQNKVTVVQLPESSMRLLLPHGYEKVKKTKALREFVKDTAEVFEGYRKTVASSDNIVMIFKTTDENAMGYNDAEGLIDSIHQCMTDTQGLVEVKSGETARGYKYIYSIVKNLSPETAGGVRYFLRLNLFYDEEIVEINADFTEIGTTGKRNALGFQLAKSTGLAELTSEGFKGWFKDPYDPEYNKGRLMNLSEKEGLDGLFPEHPLSQVREFLLAVLKDELIDAARENEILKTDQSTTEEEQSKTEEEKREILLKLFEDCCRRKTYRIDEDIIIGKPEREIKSIRSELDNTESTENSIKGKFEKKKDSLDDRLKQVVTEYNAAYTVMNDHGTKLFNQRERAIDLLDNVENLINSIANHPKEFDSDIAEIKLSKKEFRDVCDFAREELAAAQRSAVGAGAGVAGGVAVVSLAPSAAMWIATTFGTASTGTAISTLSGAAATNAALAWLGGGALAAGGSGMAAGEALLALAGPVGWSIAGATLLTSVVLFANKKIKLDKEKKSEIESVLKNAEQLKETDGRLSALLDKTDGIRTGLNGQYTSAMMFFGKSFTDIPEDGQMLLGTIVNNAKALARSLGEGV